MVCGGSAGMEEGEQEGREMVLVLQPLCYWVTHVLVVVASALLQRAETLPHLTLQSPRTRPRQLQAGGVNPNPKDLCSSFSCSWFVPSQWEQSIDEESLFLFNDVLLGMRVLQGWICGPHKCGQRWYAGWWQWSLCPHCESSQGLLMIPRHYTLFQLLLWVSDGHYNHFWLSIQARISHCLTPQKLIHAYAKSSKTPKEFFTFWGNLIEEPLLLPSLSQCLQFWSLARVSNAGILL